MIGIALRLETTKCGKHPPERSQAKEETRLFRLVIVLGCNLLEKLASQGSHSRSHPIHDVARSESETLAAGGERSTLIVWEHGLGCHCVHSRICQTVSHQTRVMNNRLRTSHASYYEPPWSCFHEADNTHYPYLSRCSTCGRPVLLMNGAASVALSIVLVGPEMLALQFSGKWTCRSIAGGWTHEGLDKKKLQGSCD